MSKDSFELTGQKVQGYTISKAIGQGKFSIVYRAESERGMPFALKKIKIFDMADQKQREKCLKEVQLMKLLKHENIISFVDSFIHNNQLIIVTEWAEKGDLKKLIKEHQSDEVPFEEPLIWEYMRQISTALKHMHEKRIMHRDLKPANIFISHDMTLKVGDLGLGRIFSQETMEAYSKVGTPLYMSPELIQDSGYTENADVWSLGCICYELCELNSPFRNKQEKMSLMDLFENITKCNYKPINSRYSKELSDVIKSMIVVDPGQRLSSQQVCGIAEKNLQNIRKPRLDPVITMEDISAKLNLLEYHNGFIKEFNRKPIHRLYFALPDRTCPPNDQLYHFLQLSYWLLGCSKPDRNRLRSASHIKSLIDYSSAEQSCNRIMGELNNSNIKLEDVTASSLQQGHGEQVCLLLNEILNRQLIRNSFRFLKPTHLPEDASEPQAEMSPQKAQQQDEPRIEQDEQEEEPAEEESQFEQSILFKNQRGTTRQQHPQAFLEKIKEYDEQDEKSMIRPRVDQQEWIRQCIRVDKKLSQLTSNTRDMLKKGDLRGIDTCKINSAKIKDQSAFANAATVKLTETIGVELEKIREFETKMNVQYEPMRSQFAVVQIQLEQKAQTQNMLSEYISEQKKRLIQIEVKLEALNSQEKTTLQEDPSQKASRLRKALTTMKEEIGKMDQKRGILEWGLLQCRLASGKGQVQNESQLDNWEQD